MGRAGGANANVNVPRNFPSDQRSVRNVPSRSTFHPSTTRSTPNSKLQPPNSKPRIGRRGRFRRLRGDFFPATSSAPELGRGSQVVRPRSAKPLCVGSIPTRASNSYFSEVKGEMLEVKSAREPYRTVTSAASEDGLRATISPPFRGSSSNRSRCQRKTAPLRSRSRRSRSRSSLTAT